MKDPGSCTWPHTRLCVHGCMVYCKERDEQHMPMGAWRKRQVLEEQNQQLREEVAILTSALRDLDKVK